MNNNVDVIQRRRGLSLDGVRSAGPQQAVRPAILQPHPRPKQRTYYQPMPAPKEYRLWQRMQLPMLLMAGAVGGFFADNLILGLSLIAGYGLFAFVNRIASRTTFMLAFLLLGAISVMLLLKPSAELIRNFATYAFALLLVGVITLGREARPPKRMRRKYKR